MGYKLETVGFPSSDGKNTVYGEIYTPKEGEPFGIVQLAHGMVDHIGRYKNLASYLTGKGYIFAGSDHLGHGNTAATAEDFGYFARRGGYSLVIDDVYKMNRLLRERYPHLPIVLMGHSMGSFVARLYAVRYPESISGLIIHGTAGKNPLLPLGLLLTRFMRIFGGERYRSELVTSLAIGSYNKRFDKSEGKNAWLTRDGAQVSDREGDARTRFIFTVSGYTDLFRMLGGCNKRSWYKSYPKKMPTLVISGEADPVGGFGKGVRKVYEGLLRHGVRTLSLKTYEGARHELFNEFNRDEVFSDIAEWLSSALEAE